MLRNLCGVFGRACSDELYEGFLVALEDRDIESVEINAIAWLRSQDRMPMPVDLAHDGETPESPESRAIAAWSEARKSWKAGAAIADRHTAALIDHFGGPARIGQMPTEEVHSFLRREFVKLYAQRLREESIHDARAAVRASLVGGREGLPT